MITAIISGVLTFTIFTLTPLSVTMVISGCLGDFQVVSGDGPLPMAIFELLEYIVNEVTEQRLEIFSVLPVIMH